MSRWHNRAPHWDDGPSWGHAPFGMDTGGITKTANPRSVKK